MKREIKKKLNAVSAQMETKSEDLNYKQLLEVVGVGVIEHDPNGAIVYADETAQKLLGLSLAQLQGKTALDKDWEAIHPDGSPFPGEEHPVLEVVKTGKPILGVEMGVYQPQKQSHTWLLVDTAPLFQAGEDKPYKIVTTFADISERIEYRRLFKKQLQLQEILTKTSRTFISVRKEEISKVIQEALSEMGRFVNVDRFYVFEYDFEKHLASNTYEWCEEGISAHINEMQDLPLQAFEDYIEIHKRGENILIDDVFALPQGNHLREIMLSQNVKSAFALPLMDGDKCLGFIGLDAVKRHHAFTSIEQTLLNVFAGILVNVQIRLKSEEDLQQSKLNLTRRYKELDCIYNLIQLNQVENLSLSSYFESVVEIIPQGFQIPEETHVRVLFGNEIYASENFAKTSNAIKVAINSIQDESCILEIFGPEKISFSEAEKQLINNLKKNIELRFEKKIAKRSLQESERKYRIIADNNYHWEFWNGANGIFVYHSPACKKITGYTDKELTENRGLYESLIHPDDVAFFRQHHANIHLQKGPEKHYFRIISKEKELKHIEHVCQPIFDENGKFLGIRGTNIDITDRILAEETLRNSEERLRNLVNSQTNYVVRTDMQGNYTYWNKKYREDFEWIYLDEISDDFHKFNSLHAVVPDHQIRVIETVQKCMANPGEIVKVEFDKRYRNGTVMNTLWEFVAITDGNNNPIEIQCMGFNISDRKLAELKQQESEKRFSEIAEHSRSVIWELDLNGNYVYLNPVVETVFGYKPEELIGRNSYDLHPPEMREQYKQMAEKLIKENKSIINFESPIQRKDGQVVWVSTSSTPVYENNKIVKYVGTDVDITARKQAEEELNKFRIISDQANVGTAITTLDGNVTYCNQVMADMHGYTIGELIGKNLTVFHCPEQMEKVAELINLIKVDGGFAAEEVGHCKKDGSKFPTLMSAKVIFDDKNNPKFMSATVIDITEKKKAEQEILKFRIIADQANYGVAISDMSGVLEYCNPTFAEMHGWFVEELVGKHISTFYMNDVDLANNTLREIVESGGLLSKEIERSRKDGSTFPAMMIAKIISDENNQALFLSATIIDISERKNYEKEIVELNKNLEVRIEERTKELAEKNNELLDEIEIRSKTEFELISKSNELETFFSVTIDLLCIASVDGKFLKLNKAWESTLGFKIDELERHSFLDFVHPDDLNSTLDSMKLLSLNNPVLKFTNRYRTVHGDYRFIEWHSVPVGNLIYAAARDITERIRVENELKEAQVIAEKANRSKSDFLSRMSHELRTPLNSILGFAQLLEMGHLEASQEKGVHHILKSGKHLLNLINEVLDISRIESGQLSVSIEPIEVNYLINEVNEIVHTSAIGKNITIHLPINSNTPVFVKADKQRLKQILINLVNNAIKYNHDGGEVWISTECITADSNQTEKLRISVRDNGMGISEGNINRIFHPFERIGAEKTNIEGTGLGLAVVKQLADLLGASLGVESKINRGSTFWLELIKVENDLEKLYHNLEMLENEGPEDVSHGTVLYIEDTHSNIELVKQIIAAKLPEVQLIVENYGKKAVEVSKRNKPDLILLDLNLPDIHGSEVLDELKNNPETSHIPVVIISADVVNSQLEKLLNTGASNYFVKPIDVSLFIQEVIKHIKKPKT